jgi:hypothetical protein
VSGHRFYPYTIRQSGIWLFQGFAAPIFVFICSIILVTLWVWITSDNHDFEEAYEYGRAIAILGLVLSMGGFGISTLMGQGWRWRTLLRAAGFILGIVALIGIVMLGFR